MEENLSKSNPDLARDYRVDCPLEPTSTSQVGKQRFEPKTTDSNEETETRLIRCESISSSTDHSDSTEFIRSTDWQLSEGEYQQSITSAAKNDAVSANYDSFSEDSLFWSDSRDISLRKREVDNKFGLELTGKLEHLFVSNEIGVITCFWTNSLLSTRLGLANITKLLRSAFFSIIADKSHPNIS
ncbi:hypothetical protein EG68_01780 [Paragonimus skrjabini miyazakii]|uniref:Uncharacterized protein n=1 Tax=Paragonimus skrjabini miyazakii TaxID=59628 RepID=A0A8S9ZCB6_9TREM|nr:hypothetical protein EG68_01780 [Paragonimus skrjabini miyazakii]